MDPEDLRVKLENRAEMDCLASLEPLDPQVTLATAQSGRKVSQGSQGKRVVPAAPASPAQATSEHPAFAESLESPV